MAVTIDAARAAGLIKKSSVNKVIVDTTVMPKAIAHPTDSRLLAKSRQHLIKLADEHDIDLRQNYNRQAPRMAAHVGRNVHAKQYKHLRKAVKTRVGRVHGEFQHKLEQLQDSAQPKAKDLLHRVRRILTQQTKDKNKLYVLHAPEVECISKGKARTPYEFGVKVTIATTLKEGLVVGMRSMPGNPYDGHTLQETIEQVEILTDKRPSIAIVDKGYMGAELAGTQILRSGQRTGVTQAMKAMIKRRSAIEPAIGHMKMDDRLGRNPLRGAIGDALHAVLCGAGHNIRMLIKKLRLPCSLYGLNLRALLQGIPDMQHCQFRLVV